MYIQPRIYSLIAAFAGLLLPIYGQGIRFFEGSFPEAQAQAAKENKFLFVEAGASWCRPCKYMEKKVFTQPEVGEFFNARFVSFKFEIDKLGGNQLANKLKVESLPTMLFFRPDGQLAHQVLNVCKPEELIRQAKNALDPDYKLQGQIEQYQQGDTSQQFLSAFILNLHAEEKDSFALAVYPIYWRQLSDKDKTTKTAFTILSVLNLGAYSAQFSHLLAHRRSYEKQSGASAVHRFINSTLAAELYGFIHLPYPDIQQRITDFLAFVKNAQPSEYRYFYRLTWFNYHNARDPRTPEWLQAADAYLPKYATDHQELQRCAKLVVRFGKQASDYQTALKWVQKGLKIKTTAEGLAIKGWLLHKLQRDKQALALARQSVQAAAQEQTKPDYAQELLNLLQKPQPKQ